MRTRRVAGEQIWLKISEAEIVGGVVRQGCAAGYALNRMRLSAEDSAQDN
jgi:hypothetical protein